MPESDPHPVEPSLPGAVDAPRGGVRVERYGGLKAGEAIVAIRRAGLRPGPERVEGYEPDVHGFVVGQEPAAGTQLAPESFVRLLVAAPSRALDAQQPDGEVEDELQGEEPVYEEPPLEEWHTGEPVYADETVEVHEIVAPSGHAPEDPIEDSWRESSEEEPVADEERAAPFGPVGWRGERHAHTSGRLARRAEARLAAWRSLPPLARWGCAAFAGCLLLIILVAVLDGHATRAPGGPSLRAGVVARPFAPGVPVVSHTSAREPRAGHSPRVHVGKVGGPRSRVRCIQARVAAARPVAVSDGEVTASAPVPVRTVVAASGVPVGREMSGEEHFAREFGFP